LIANLLLSDGCSIVASLHGRWLAMAVTLAPIYNRQVCRVLHWI
jgi:hypothetical protein